MKRISDAVEKKLVWMNDLDRFSSIYFQTSLSRMLDMEYMCWNGSVAPSLKGIVWSTHQEEGSMQASFSEKRTR